MNRHNAFWIIFFFGIFVLSACGGGKAADDDNGAKEPVVSKNESGAEKAVTFYASRPTTLDPHRAGDVGSGRIINEVYAGLLTLGEVPPEYVVYTVDGYPTIEKDIYANLPELWQDMTASMTKSGEKEIVLLPDLAEEIPEVQFNDESEPFWVFEIRPDAKFSNGQPITASDVEFSLLRALDPRLDSTTAELYLSNIKGALERLYDRQGGWKKGIEGVEVLGEHTLKITANKFTSEFLWKLTYPTGFVVQATQAGEDPSRNQAWVRGPVASGAFTIEETNRERTVLRKNVYSHKEPKVDKIVMIHNVPSDPLSEFEDGKIHITGVGTELIEDIRDSSNPLYKLALQGSSLDVFYIEFRTDKPPFDDPILRQAFAAAIDKEGIAHHTIKDMVIPARGFVPPGIPGYDEALEGVGFNPERARELFRQSKYYSAENDAIMIPVRVDDGEKKLEPYRFVLNRSGENPQQGNFLTVLLDEWEEILGIEIETETREYAQYLEDKRAGKYAISLSGWILDYPHASNIAMLFYSEVSTANRSSFYVNDEFDRLFREAQASRDPNEQAELFSGMNEMLATEVPAIPLIHGIDYALVSPKLKGYIPHSITIPRWHLVDLADKS